MRKGQKERGRSRERKNKENLRYFNCYLIKKINTLGDEQERAIGIRENQIIIKERTGRVGKDQKKRRGGRIEKNKKGK